MKDRGRSAIVAGLSLFLVLSTAAQGGVAALYARSVSRLKASASIRERDMRVFARPVRIEVGQRISRAQIEEHLQRIGYLEACGDDPGCYSAGATLESLSIRGRYPEHPDVTIYWDGDAIAAITGSRGELRRDTTLEPDTIFTAAAHAGAIGRTSHEPIPYAALAESPLLDAVIASEDRWFRTHHGLDLPRLALTPLSGGGGSTITMQVARMNVLQDRRRTFARKVSEIGVAMAIERLHSKQAILTAYVNSVYLGVTRGRSVHGFGAAAREFFGVRDVRQLTDLQAATLVALLNQPSRYLEDLQHGDEARLRKQRNRVLRLMQKNFPERYSDSWARALEDRPVVFAAPASTTDGLYRASRHFLDYTSGVTPISNGRVYLTLDARLQRIASETVEQGLALLESRFFGGRRRALQAALIVTDPKTGDVLAMVGGRSYDRSQFNRTSSAARQVGSIMKPFGYLAAFERAADEGRSDASPDSVVVDLPTVFHFAGRRPWKPANYGDSYAGSITWRRALAESRNVAAVKVAAAAGFDRVARMWRAASGQRLPNVHPSIALGAIEATPAEVAASYSVFATGGVVTPLRTVLSFVTDSGTTHPRVEAPRRVAREESARAVAEMMRAVVDEGTGRAVRASGFAFDAAGKTGTTDALRDAWFAGFSGDLLAVVWVGRDDARPLGLTGAEAALPLWTQFMTRARE